MAVLVKVFALFAVFFVVSALPFENLDDVQLPQLDEAATEDLANVNFMAQQPGTRQKRTLDLLTGLKSYSYPRYYYPTYHYVYPSYVPSYSYGFPHYGGLFG